MVLPASAADPRPPAPWLASVARQLARARQGLLILARGASSAQLGPVVRTLAPSPPWATPAPGLEICLHAPELAELVPGSQVLLRVCRAEDITWLNLHRPLIAARGLRVLLWADEAASDRLFREAVDFSDWISRIVDVPAVAAPPFALEGLAAALAAAAPILWSGPSLAPALAEVAAGLPTLEIDGSAPLRRILRDLERPGLPIVTHLGSLRAVIRWVFARALAGRAGPYILLDLDLDPELALPGLWRLHAHQWDWEAATRALVDAGWERPALVAAWLDLEPERLAAAVDRGSPAGFDGGEWPSADIATAAAPAFVLRRRYSEPAVIAARANLRPGGALPLGEDDRALLVELAELAASTPSEDLIKRLAAREHTELAMELALRRWERGEREGVETLVEWLLAYGRSAEAAAVARATVEAWERRLEESPGDITVMRGLADGLRKLGDVEVVAGNLQGARELFTRSLEIRERLATADPQSAQAQRDLSVSLERLGGAEVAAGNLQGARDLYTRDLEIAERLTTADPDSAQAQRDLSISLERLGAVALVAGSLQGGRDLFARSLEVLERLATVDTDSAQAQHDLSISLDRLGLVEVLAGNLQGARDLFARSLEVRERLATADPDSAQAQRDVSVSLERLGDVEVAAGNLQGARDLFARSLEVRERLATADPQSAQAQRELSVSYNKLGNVEAAAGNLQRARDRFARSLEIAERLAQEDAQSAQAQRELSISYKRLGVVEVATGNLERARDLYTRDLEIAERLVKEDAQSAQAQRDLSVSLERLGDVEVAAGNLERARDRFERSLEIRERLAQAEAQSAQAQRDLSVSYQRMARVDEAHAITWLGKAVAIRSERLEADPTDTTAVREMALALIGLGMALHEEGEQEAAASSLTQAHQLFEHLRELGALEPRFVEVADRLAYTLNKEG